MEAMKRDEHNNNDLSWSHKYGVKILLRLVGQEEPEQSLSQHTYITTYLWYVMDAIPCSIINEQIIWLPGFYTKQQYFIAIW